MPVKSRAKVPGIRFVFKEKKVPSGQGRTGEKNQIVAVQDQVKSTSRRNERVRVIVTVDGYFNVQNVQSKEK